MDRDLCSQAGQGRTTLHSQEVFSDRGGILWGIAVTWNMPHQRAAQRGLGWWGYSLHMQDLPLHIPGAVISCQPVPVGGVLGSSTSSLISVIKEFLYLPVLPSPAVGLHC